MISEWFLSLCAQFVTWVGTSMGPWTPPTALTDATDAAAGFLGTLGAMGVWIDWGVLGACVAASVAVWAGVVIVKLIRAIAAHIPAFGGAGD